VKKINLQRVLLFVVLFGTMLTFGLVENIRGISYPLIRDEFDVPFERQGIMVAMIALAYALSNILAGIFLGRFGIKPATFAGFAAIGLGIVLIPFVPGFFPVTVALFIVSGGGGFLEIGMNALASRVFVAKAALLMNLLHSFYGLGSVIGPRVAGFIISETEFGWRSAYLFSLPLVLLTLSLALIARFPKNDPQADGAPEPAGASVGTNPESDTGQKTFFDALRTPMVWLFAAILGLGVIIEVTTPNWGPLYFLDIHGLCPATEGAAFISTFFLLFTLSRLICGPLVEKIGYVRSLLGVSVLTLAVFAVGFSMGARGIYVLPALGFLVALFWPTMMAVAIVTFRKDAPVFAGAMIAIAGLINSVAQFLVGLTNRMIGPAWGYRSGMFYTALLALLLLFLYKNLKRRSVKKI